MDRIERIERRVDVLTLWVALLSVTGLTLAIVVAILVLRVNEL